MAENDSFSEFFSMVCKKFDAVPVSKGLESFRIRAVVDEQEAEPETLDQVRDLLGECQRCKLCSGRKTLVFGSGPQAPSLMVVGEGPGEHEDLLGEPFVGLAGEMLDRMLKNVLGLERSQVYVTNVVKCRTSKDNRDPEPDEISSCLPFLEMQKKVLRPSFVLLLGRVAIESVLGVEGGVKANRGKWFQWDGVPAIATFHPAYLLRNEQDKRKTLEDLRMLEAMMNAQSREGG